MSPLRDLEPLRNPLGGSPKSPPRGIPLAEFQEYPTPTPQPITITNGNGTIWKVTTSGLAGLFIGMTVAWFTATQNKGVTQKDMQDYVDRFSPYSHDKEIIALQQASQDEKIGALNGFKDRLFDRIKTIEEDRIIEKRDVADHDNKIKLLTNYIEAERVPKK